MGIKEMLKRKIMFVGKDISELTESQKVGYLLGENDYAVRNTELATFLVKTNNFNLAESDFKEGIILKTPKIPYRLLMEIIGFSAIMQTTKPGIFNIIWNGNNYYLKIPKQIVKSNFNNNISYVIKDNTLKENETLFLSIEINNKNRFNKNVLAFSEVEYKEKPIFKGKIYRNKIKLKTGMMNVNFKDLFEIPIKEEKVSIDGITFSKVSTNIEIKENEIPIFKGINVDKSLLENIQLEKKQINSTSVNNEFISMPIFGNNFGYIDFNVTEEGSINVSSTIKYIKEDIEEDIEEEPQVTNAKISAKNIMWVSKEKIIIKTNVAKLLKMVNIGLYIRKNGLCFEEYNHSEDLIQEKMVLKLNFKTKEMVAVILKEDNKVSYRIER